jgi:dTDP-glucose pyrophosphorylase
MKLVIIAGGKGTRLGRGDVPKPMVEVAGRTVLEHQLLVARRYGIDEVYVLSGHLAAKTFDHLGDGSRLGMRITHVIEPYPLGTAGSVALLKHVLDDRFLVFYGDAMLDLDLDYLRAFDGARRPMATLVAHPNDHPFDSDLLEVDDADGVIAWHAKPHAEDASLGNLVNAGAYILSPEIFEHIPFGTPNDFGRDIFPALLNAGHRLVAYRTAEFIKDMGTPQRLGEIDHACRSGRIARLNRSNSRKAIFLDIDGLLHRPLSATQPGEPIELNNDAAPAIRAINRSELLAVAVAVKSNTNQEPSTLRAAQSQIETLLGREHAWIDATVTTHSATDVDAPLLRVVESLNIDLAGSCMVTDRRELTAVALRFGARPIGIRRTPAWNAVVELLTRGDVPVRSKEAA